MFLQEKKKKDPLTTFPLAFPRIFIHQESVPLSLQFTFDQASQDSFDKKEERFLLRNHVKTIKKESIQNRMRPFPKESIGLTFFSFLERENKTRTVISSFIVFTGRCKYVEKLKILISRSFSSLKGTIYTNRFKERKNAGFFEHFTQFSLPS